MKEFKLQDIVSPEGISPKGSLVILTFINESGLSQGNRRDNNRKVAFDLSDVKGPYTATADPEMFI